MAEYEDFDRFANEVAEWLIEKYGEYKDPMMMGGVLMRATMEPVSYTHLTLPTNREV